MIDSFDRDQLRDRDQLHRTMASKIPRSVYQVSCERALAEANRLRESKASAVVSESGLVHGQKLICCPLLGGLPGGTAGEQLLSLLPLPLAPCNLREFVWNEAAVCMEVEAMDMDKKVPEVAQPGAFVAFRNATCGHK